MVTVMNLPSSKKGINLLKTKRLSFKITHPIVQLEANMQRKKPALLKYKFFAPAHIPFSMIAVDRFRMHERE